MSTKTQRNKEYRKYQKLYFHTEYGMGHRRYNLACKDLKELPIRGSYLDVGCGKGEMLKAAKQMGYAPVAGTEVIDSLINEDVYSGEPMDLPFDDKSFDVVSLFDVLEHLLLGDEYKVCQELKRVARKYVLITANNRPSKLSDFIEEVKKDEPLHINIRPFSEWHGILADVFGARNVTRLKPKGTNLARWRIESC